MSREYHQFGTPSSSSRCGNRRTGASFTQVRAATTPHCARPRSAAARDADAKCAAGLLENLLNIGPCRAELNSLHPAEQTL